MAKAYIIASVRTAVGRAFKGSLKDTRPDDLLTAAIRGALDRVPNLDPSRVDDVIAGCAMPEGEQGMNVARICSLKAGLPDSVPAGGVPRRYKVTREDQDQFAYHSHRKALAAIRDGRFREEIVPVSTVLFRQSDGGTPVRKEIVFDTDDGPRADTTVEALSKLKPAFDARGTVTAGNSSQMSDGAAAAIVVSEKALKGLGVEPMARFLGFAVAGVAPEVMGIGPIEAIPKLLKRLRMKLTRVDLVELNEAFAAQALPVIRELSLDPDKVNVNGGAIALGHPLGCTGAKLTASLLHEMKRRNASLGLVSMCIGGGMGAAGLFERA